MRLARVQRRPRIDAGHHLATLDAAFRHDAFVVSIFHLELRDGPEGSMRECIVQDAVLHLQPKFMRPVRFDDAVQRTADLLRQYGITRIYGDAHGSDALRPALAERGITLDVLSSSSPAITARIETFLMRVSNARFEFLEHDAQRKEVLESILTHHSGGRVTLRAPEGRGKHDDLLSALLLACDADTAAKLPPCGGSVVCEFLPVGWDPASRSTYGAARGSSASSTGAVSRALPRGTWWFEQWARGLLAQGLSDPEIDAFARTRGIDPTREVFTAERLFDAISIPGEPIPRHPGANDAPPAAPETEDQMLGRIARGE